MNDRILELADQARFVKTTDYPSQDEVFQKFAELIALECLSIADPRGAYDVMDDIIERFGLEQ